MLSSRFLVHPSDFDRSVEVPIIESATAKPCGLVEARVTDPDGFVLILVEVPPTNPFRRDPRSAWSTLVEVDCDGLFRAAHRKRFPIFVDLDAEAIPPSFGVCPGPSRDLHTIERVGDLLAGRGSIGLGLFQTREDQSFELGRDLPVSHLSERERLRVQVV